MKFLILFRDNKALISSVQQAIDFVNAQQGKWQPLKANDIFIERMTALFNGEHRLNQWGQLEVIYNGFPLQQPFEHKTTGCSTDPIRIFPALADTLDEHERLYEIKIKEEKAIRIAESKALHDKRMQKLNEQRQGWYSVSLTDIRVDGYRERGNDRPKYKEFSGVVIADSGADAYRKILTNLEETLPNEMTTRDFTYSTHRCPGMDSSKYYFEFLGAKTDEGYSVELWEEWEEENNSNDNTRNHE